MKPNDKDGSIPVGDEQKPAPSRVPDGNTGYFARPQKHGHYNELATKVHYVLATGKVLCGYKPHSTMQFQHCACGIHWDYLECTKCRRKIAEALSRCPGYTKGRPTTLEKQKLLARAKENGLDFGQGFKCTISIEKLRKLVEIINQRDRAFAALKSVGMEL